MEKCLKSALMVGSDWATQEPGANNWVSLADRPAEPESLQGVRLMDI